MNIAIRFPNLWDWSASKVSLLQVRCRGGAAISMSAIRVAIATGIFGVSTAFGSVGWKSGKWVPDPPAAKAFLSELSTMSVAPDGRKWAGNLFDQLINKDKRSDIEDLKLLGAARLSFKGTIELPNGKGAQQYGLDPRILRIINSDETRWEAIALLSYCELCSSPEVQRVQPDIGKKLTTDYPKFFWLYETRILHYLTMQYPEPWPGYPKGVVAIFDPGCTSVLADAQGSKLPAWQYNLLCYSYEFYREGLTQHERSSGYLQKIVKMIVTDPETPGVVKKKFKKWKV